LALFIEILVEEFLSGCIFFFSFMAVECVRSYYEREIFQNRSIFAGFVVLAEKNLDGKS